MTLLRRALALVLSFYLLFTSAPPGMAQETTGCQYQFGFQTLHQQIPEIVGDCVTNEIYDPAQGWSTQITQNGVLIWRASDNWTGFVAAETAWVLGPGGAQSVPAAATGIWGQDQSTTTVQLYFSRHPESDQDFAAVFPVQRAVTVSGQQIATATLEALIVGPTPAEQTQGYFSELDGMLSGASSCGGRDFSLSIEPGGTAVVQFCRQVMSAGVGQDARVSSQIEATLTQFSTITDVRLLDDAGNCLFDQSGLNLCFA